MIIIINMILSVSVRVMPEITISLRHQPAVSNVIVTRTAKGKTHSVD